MSIKSACRNYNSIHWRVSYKPTSITTVTTKILTSPMLSYSFNAPTLRGQNPRGMGLFWEFWIEKMKGHVVQARSTTFVPDFRIGNKDVAGCPMRGSVFCTSGACIYSGGSWACQTP